MTFRALLLLSSSLLAVACSCSETSDPDGGGPDAGNTDAPTAFDAGFDANLDDAPTGSDTPGVSDDAPTDANVASDDAPILGTDAGGCEYTALDEVIVECEGMPTFVSLIGVFPPSDECPEYWVVGSRPTHYESAEQAIASESCDAGCQWHFSTSVTRLYCGRRTGYEVLRADGKGCEDLYRFDDGYYPSVEAYDDTHPCPD
jgi:hypothetical protein